MKIPRNLRGKTLAEVLCRHWGYEVVHQQGSHIILDTQSPSHQRISIPSHSPLRIGTLNNILKSVSGHKQVSKQDILDTL
jgi:predicted RNA binding protein YcfA (HicA-like mRNA interferase family)